MNHFTYQNNELLAENISVLNLAKKYNTPLYIYSAKTIRRHYEVFAQAFANINHLICFSVKANSNLSVLKLLAEMGAGVDIVSGGELFRALKAGFEPKKIVYSGVGKCDHEIREALQAGILLFNVESIPELERISEIATQMQVVANVSFRINPDVDPKTHPYISTGMRENKFGLSRQEALKAYLCAAKLPNIEPIGMDCHIGSQLTTIEPFLEALDRLIDFYKLLQTEGIKLQYLDLGGGLGIIYDDEKPPLPAEFGQALESRLKKLDLSIILEPGRVIVGNSGILVTEIQYIKNTEDKKFVIVDAGMNDLIRPALYGSFHKIQEVVKHERPEDIVEIVGPICESSDFFAKQRALPALKAGEFLAIFSAGAYGFVMSSQYNSRVRPAELIIDGDEVHVARKRETYNDLIALEL